MPGFMPGIHVFTTHNSKDVDGRDKPGHDVEIYGLIWDFLVSASLAFNM
jgi:hypothetical protein